jgi:hypothetical protein
MKYYLQKLSAYLIVAWCVFREGIQTRIGGPEFHIYSKHDLPRLDDNHRTQMRRKIKSQTVPKVSLLTYAAFIPKL